MPGATTARFVVCAFEMPMKLSMMPQTVPNRPTKGAVAPIVARMPVPREIFRPAAISMRSDCQAMRSFKPSARKLAESRISFAAACMSCATGPLPLRSFSCACASVVRLGEHAQSAPNRGACAKKLDAFGDPDRPGHERSNRKADHDRLHDGIGMQEHAPRGEVLRQVGDGKRIALLPGPDNICKRQCTDQN